jgi:hypothetical protein
MTAVSVLEAPESFQITVSIDPIEPIEIEHLPRDEIMTKENDTRHEPSDPSVPVCKRVNVGEHVMDDSGNNVRRPIIRPCFDFSDPANKPGHTRLNFLLRASFMDGLL